MPKRLAVQLYTLRDRCKTPVEIAATLARVARLGYSAVQASALGPIEPRELRKILDDNGLTCCATHESWDAIRDEPQSILDKLAALDCTYTALGGFWPTAGGFTRDAWSAFAADFTRAATALAAGGVRLGYHNHQHEFIELDGGETAYALLARSLGEACWFELDTYWVQVGGADPAAWIERFAGRVPCVHFKDLGIAADRAQQMRPVGRGNLNWDRIIAVCATADVAWHIVEQDNCNGLDPFDCLAKSREFLVARGFA